MIRDLDALSARRFDLLVVGGGICGLMAAWDASTRGLRVALIDRHDFGGGASFNHHRTLHGGLRYLQSVDLARLRESVRERRTWARIAPHLIAPQRFAVAADGARGKNALLLRAGLFADACLAADRNTGIDRVAAPVAGPRRVRRAIAAALDTGELLPEAAALAVWSDYRTEHAERLTLAVALAASRAGAVLANYLDAIEPIRDQGRIAGDDRSRRCRRRAAGYQARVTINAAGSAAGRVMAAFGVRRQIAARESDERRDAAAGAARLPAARPRPPAGFSSRSLATAAGDWNLARIGALRRGRRRRHAAGARQLHRRDQRRLSLAAPGARRRHAGPARHRARKDQTWHHVTLADRSAAFASIVRTASMAL